ncbi:N-acetylmuramoyl-L-alanine amidase [Aestuariibacter salexigens]|uniref:N-acetylmuramoyl-L-alanine amidase n=1 Tax=Aestuariibacter salexigens TaxID=226010 RepID=UPI00041E7914|nr:N-acetylmuramoyl-L-alanine amidase [Aestuariibacter salexigens]
MGSVLLSHPIFAKINRVDSLRVWPSPTSTRVVFDLAAEPEYTYFPLTNPERLVIDFDNTDKKVDFSQFDISGDLIKNIRHSTPKHDDGIRVVIELNRKAKPEIFAMPPTEPYGDRLVIDLIDSRPAAPQVVLDRTQNQRDRDIIVAIDAGHGGEDPGSIGPSGTYEKNITLSISRKLETLINAEPGMRAVMIRTADYYIHPNRRPELAREHKADLLISVHADAFHSPQPRGASVWVLSMRRADNELGRWMENTERHSVLLGGAAEVITDKASERYLTETILGLSMDYSMATSYDVSESILRELKKVTKLHKRAPQAASLAVLTSPDIPSILVEVGFISNPQEEKNLNWAKYRQDLAESLFTAVSHFFRKTPPEGTLWASQRAEQRTHKVRSGESLSLLAQRYNVKVSSIKQANNMTSDMVRIGQVLTIPRI